MLASGFAELRDEQVAIMRLMSVCLAGVFSVSASIVVASAAERSAPILPDRSAAPIGKSAAIHGRPIELARGFGVAHIGDAPVTLDTVFQAPAIGRLSAAMAVLGPVDSRNVTDVKHYLKPRKILESSFTDRAKVTLRQLLSNTEETTVAGFRDIFPATATRIE